MNKHILIAMGFVMMSFLLGGCNSSNNVTGKATSDIKAQSETAVPLETGNNPGESNPKLTVTPLPYDNANGPQSSNDQPTVNVVQ